MSVHMLRHNTSIPKVLLGCLAKNRTRYWLAWCNILHVMLNKVQAQYKIKKLNLGMLKALM